MDKIALDTFCKSINKILPQITEKNIDTSYGSELLNKLQDSASAKIQIGVKIDNILYNLPAVFFISRFTSGSALF